MAVPPFGAISIGTGAAMLIVIIAAAIIDGIKEDTTAVAIFIAVSNGMLPSLMKFINSFEPHPTETAQEASLLFKLVAAR